MSCLLCLLYLLYFACVHDNMRATEMNELSLNSADCQIIYFFFIDYVYKTSRQTRDVTMM